MFKQAITRTPCRALINGISTSGLGTPIYEQSLEQHHAYVRALQACGLDVTVLPPAEDFPDSVFVEDAALCTRYFAVITRPGASSRRGEAELIAPALQRFYKVVERIVEPGTLDAGDVMMAGSHYYIGNSARTNQDGARQLIAILNKHGLTGSIIEMPSDVLHLKTGLAYLENNHLLAAGAFVTMPEFARYNVIEVPWNESYAANCIWINDAVVMPAGYPTTRENIAALGYKVIEVETSEYRKLDGGVSCLSLRF